MSDYKDLEKKHYPVTWDIVEEDILILETSDELFEVEGCDLIFSSTNNQKEVLRDVIESNPHSAY